MSFSRRELGGCYCCGCRCSEPLSLNDEDHFQPGSSPCESSSPGLIRLNVSHELVCGKSGGCSVFCVQVPLCTECVCLGGHQRGRGGVFLSSHSQVRGRDPSLGDGSKGVSCAEKARGPWCLLGVLWKVSLLFAGCSWSFLQHQTLCNISAESESLANWSHPTLAPVGFQRREARERVQGQGLP